MDTEVDPSHGVFRTSHVCDPISRWDWNSDFDLNNNQIGSSPVKQIFPSHFDQMVAKNIHTFMQPDFNPEEALKYVKEFMQKGESQRRTQAVQQNVDEATSEFYTYWEDEWTPFESSNQFPAKVPSAPSGPAPAQDVHSTTRMTPPSQEDEISYEMANAYR